MANPWSTVTTQGPAHADPSLSREALSRVFGPHAFAPGLFYAHEPALRFELSRHGSRMEQFTQALDRAREIMEFVFRDSALPVVVLSWPGGSTPLRGVAVRRSLREFGVMLRRPRTGWTETYQGELGPEERTLLALRVDRQALVPLLWGALAADLGVRPRLDALLYLLDPERGLLLHPYDDRGMDVIGPNRERLVELFHRFRAYLLPHDLARMEGFFAATPG